MNNNHEIEKSLKRFLKKKVAYTASLLIAFLITGSIAFGTSEELATVAGQTQEELLAKIEAQKEEILAQIEANNARILELNKDQ